LVKQHEFSGIPITAKVAVCGADNVYEVDYMVETQTVALKDVLVKENDILDKVLAQQAVLRASVRGKKWDTLMDTIEQINMLADEFKSAEEEREAVSGQEAADVMPILAEVRGKLVRSKTENKALGDYITITRNFIQGVLDDAVPQSRSTVYARDGKIVHPQPSSVVVNTLY
jgi:hypothetical protein